MAAGSLLLAWAPGCLGAPSKSDFTGKGWVLPQPGAPLCLKARVDGLVLLGGGETH